MVSNELRRKISHMKHSNPQAQYYLGTAVATPTSLSTSKPTIAEIFFQKGRACSYHFGHTSAPLPEQILSDLTHSGLKITLSPSTSPKQQRDPTVH